MTINSFKTRILRLKNSFISNTLNIRIKPETLQFPITGKCNSRCSTCNIWKQHERQDVDIDSLKKVLQDDYLNEVKNVGVNGGEPFLHQRFLEVIECILELPKIERIYLISNGINTQRILDQLSSAYNLAKDKNVKINLTISLDGTDEVYSVVRGIPKGDSKVIQTLTAIKTNMDQYCDSLTIGTTISIDNVYYLSQIESISHQFGVPVNYHIAVPNRRIYTSDDYKRYSIFEDERACFVAMDFFYGLFKYSPGLKEQLLYFQNYQFIKCQGKRRHSACSYKKQDITLDEKLNVYYCAKESIKIGNACEEPIKEIMKKKEARQEERRIRSMCSSCGHYITIPTVRCLFLFAHEKLKPAAWIAYKYKCKL